MVSVVHFTFDLGRTFGLFYLLVILVCCYSLLYWGILVLWLEPLHWCNPPKKEIEINQNAASYFEFRGRQSAITEEGCRH